MSIAASLLLPVAGRADTLVPPATLTQLDSQVTALQAEFAARYAALQNETEQRLHGLEAQLAELKGGGATSLDSRDCGFAVARQAPAQDEPVLDVSGDFRLRYERTEGVPASPTRNRGVLRARVAAAYPINDRFTVGGRITTGNPDDPNSADITMDEFVNDLTVSLDQAYARYRFNDTEIVGGKFANPLARTELVWDGDVNPLGVAGRHTLYQGANSTLRVAGIYSIVDEQIAARDSDMQGAQVSFDLLPVADWEFGFDAAYYDYEIGSLLAADAGDTRNNNLIPDGSAYLSDFDLVDVVLRMNYSGLSSRWPMQVVGDYVRNLGAAVPEDSGWSLDFSLGELAETGDWRFGYGYAVAETDAVLAAFSQDNTPYATNYREHTISVDYLAMDDTYLNLTGYLLRRDNFALTNQPGDNDWLSRVRLNLQFTF